MSKLVEILKSFSDRHPKASEWIREGGLFFVVSCLITFIRGVLVTLLEPVFRFLGTEAVGFPGIVINVLGIEFPWYVIGASEQDGGVAYFTALMISMWACETVNFFMQRKFVFRSSGKMGRQAVFYFLAFLIVTCVVNAVSNIWIGVASHFVSPFIYNLGTTFITGGVSMAVFFFANKRIFSD